MKYIVGYIEREFTTKTNIILSPQESIFFKILNIQANIEDRYAIGHTITQNKDSKISYVVEYVRTIKSFDTIEKAEEYKRELEEKIQNSYIDDLSPFDWIKELKNDRKHT